jgi:TonB family protein
MLAISTGGGAKGVTIVASLVAHVAFAVAAVSGGAPMPSSAAPSIPVSAEIEIDAPVAVIDAAESVDEHSATHATTSAPHPHTHDYPVAASHDTTPHDPTLSHLLAPAAPARASAPLATKVVSRDHDAHDDGAPAPPIVRASITVTNNGATIADNAPSPARLPPGSMRGTAAGGATDGAHDHGASIGEIVPEAHVSVRARAIAKVVPAYPPAARSAQVEADVVLEIVVDTSGRVADARVVHAVGYGLDAAALDAIRRTRFSPAMHEGRAVPVRMRYPMQFRLEQ